MFLFYQSDGNLLLRGPTYFNNVLCAHLQFRPRSLRYLHRSFLQQQRKFYQKKHVIFKSSNKSIICSLFVSLFTFTSK